MQKKKSANAAATAEQRHITYHKVSQSHLPTPAQAWRGSREEVLLLLVVVVVEEGGELTAKEGDFGDTSKTLHIRRSVFPLSPSPSSSSSCRVSLSYTLTL